MVEKSGLSLNHTAPHVNGSLGLDAIIVYGLLYLIPEVREFRVDNWIKTLFIFNVNLICNVNLIFLVVIFKLIIKVV